MIIPWSSATEQERQQALSELKVFERNMADLGLEMSKQANLKGDQLLIFPLIMGGTEQSRFCRKPQSLALSESRTRLFGE